MTGAEVRRSGEVEALAVRVTTTGVVVAEGDCVHCPHPAMDHWPSEGCKAPRTGDHCRMDPTKLARVALCQRGPGCDGYSHSLPCNNAYFAAIRTPGFDSRRQATPTGGTP